MLYKRLTIACLMFLAVCISSDVFGRVVLDIVEYEPAHTPYRVVNVGESFEFYTTVGAIPTAENVVVIGTVDGAEVYRVTIPIASREITPKVSFNYKFKTAGSHIISFTADPDGVYGVPDTQSITMEVRPVDINVKGLKHISLARRDSETITIAGSFENKNDIRINEVFFVQFIEKERVIKQFEVRGMGPKESKTLEMPFKCSKNYHDLIFIVDATNAVTEFSEINNKATMRLECKKPISPGIFTPAK